MKVSKIAAGVRVLVVDDNASDRHLIKTYLNKMGITQIQEAEAGGLALFKILNADEVETPFHIMITDWVMPEKDGLTLLKMIRNERKVEHLYIIMITSVSDEKQVNAALEKGVDDFLIKPITFKVFEEKLLTALDKFTVKTKTEN